MNTQAHIIRIDAEVISPLADAVFIRAARSFSLPDANRVPGYTIALDGEILATRPTIDAAIAHAKWVRRDEPNIPIILGS